MTPPRVLVAGIGNIFLGDDAFGSEVARRLLARPQRAGVRVVDFGIRGLDLTYALLDGCGVAILIDAVPRGEAPGTLYVLEPQPDFDPGTEPPGSPMMEGHSMDPVKVLRAAAAMGARPGRILLVGCEPTPLSDPDDDMSMTMSEPVRSAIDRAVSIVESLVDESLDQPMEAPRTALPPRAAQSAAHHEEARPC